MSRWRWRSASWRHLAKPATDSACGLQDAAEAHAIAAVMLRIKGAVGAQERLAAGALPRAATQHAIFGAALEAVPTPLPDVAAQIVKAKGIGL